MASGTCSGAPSAAVRFGPLSADIDLDDAVAWAGADADAAAGNSLASPGDLSGDDIGAVHLFYGPLSSLSSPDLILRGAGANHAAGSALAGVDVSADGVDDLLVGAPGASSLQENGGAVYVWLGMGL
ncbi:MAG TPA: integrin alpha [Myxococcota bacterium]|nr:integrin alpha [Myxococcota bacterium]